MRYRQRHSRPVATATANIKSINVLSSLSFRAYEVVPFFCVFSLCMSSHSRVYRATCAVFMRCTHFRVYLRIIGLFVCRQRTTAGVSIFLFNIFLPVKSLKRASTAWYRGGVVIRTNHTRTNSYQVYIYLYLVLITLAPVRARVILSLLVSGLLCK